MSGVVSCLGLNGISRRITRSQGNYSGTGIDGFRISSNLLPNLLVIGMALKWE